MDNKERYKISLMREPVDDSYENKDIGVIMDTLTGKPVLYIVVANKCLAECRMRECMTVLGDEKQPTAACISTRLAKRLQHNHRVALFSIWHEVGHVVNKHFDGKESQEQIREERLDALKHGNACKSELEADAFAASIIGVKRTVAALKNCRRERREEDIRLGQETSPNAVIAYVEYTYRIRELERENG